MHRTYLAEYIIYFFLLLFFYLLGADVISFDGHGIISYRFRSKKMKIIKDVISLKFRTTAGEGVLLHGEGQQGDYISLELHRAKLQLSSNQYGSIQGHTSVTSGSLLDDDHWHSVVIERYRRNVNFTLDHHTQQFRTNGEFDNLDLDYEISFGGLPVSTKPSLGGKENFVGCMEGITYNGDNITNLVRRKKVDTSTFVRQISSLLNVVCFEQRHLTGLCKPQL
uniref:Laminin G domain-containing protein n=1 Tax=Acanthochromis polyacanthus TaxID=80966 RepID=A0A3Q1FVV0_9TELE